MKWGDLPVGGKRQRHRKKKALGSEHLSRESSASSLTFHGTRKGLCPGQEEQLGEGLGAVEGHRPPPG